MPLKLIFEIQYPDEKPLKRALVVYERIQDLTPAWERILPILQNYTENYLARSGAYEGNPAFAPLSPRYARHKARRYPNAPILTRSGRMRQSLASLTSDSDIVIYWSDEDEAYIAEMPELPGCAADGRTPYEALANLEQIAEEWIETAREQGRPVPEPKRRAASA